LGTGQSRWGKYRAGTARAEAPLPQYQPSCGFVTKTAPLQVAGGRILRYLMLDNSWAVADAAGKATAQTTTT